MWYNYKEEETKKKTIIRCDTITQSISSHLVSPFFTTVPSFNILFLANSLCYYFLRLLQLNERIGGGGGCDGCGGGGAPPPPPPPPPGMVKDHTFPFLGGNTSLPFGSRLGQNLNFNQNKLRDAIAISKSETINHSLTDSPTDWQGFTLLQLLGDAIAFKNQKHLFHEYPLRFSLLSAKCESPFDPFQKSQRPV